MGIYASQPPRLVGQLAADVFMVIWTVLWFVVGRAVRRSVEAIATPARETKDAATTLQEQVRAAAEQVAQVPGIGAELRKPFDATAISLGDVVTAAAQQVSSIEEFAQLLGWLVLGIPVVILLAIWLPARIRFFRRARAAQRYIDSHADLDLFALRAMANSPMHVIARISDDPVNAWRRGDRRVIDALAAVELGRCGLRPPPQAPTAAVSPPR